jgi:hypothetical protein
MQKKKEDLVYGDQITYPPSGVKWEVVNNYPEIGKIELMDMYAAPGVISTFDYNVSFSPGWEFIGNFKKSHKFKTIYKILNNEL